MPSSSPSPSPPSSTAGDASAADINAYLIAHNTVRAQHGAVDLTWNYTLAGAAQEWANGCDFQHSGGTLGPYGENLAAGTGAYGIAEAVADWANEVSQYNPKDPIPSHFTQIAWKATTDVGCAVQTCNGIFSGEEAQYYVCEYFEAGNVLGEFSENVQV